MIDRVGAGALAVSLIGDVCNKLHKQGGDVCDKRGGGKTKGRTPPLSKTTAKLLKSLGLFSSLLVHRRPPGEACRRLAAMRS